MARRAQRSVLGDQMRQLENKRSELVEKAREGTASAADRAGTEKRIADIDARIADVDKQISAADAEVARAAAIPGATVEPPRPPRQGPPEEAYVLGGMFIVIVFLPLSLAFARRIWRRSAAVTVKASSELQERMTAIERAVDSVAVEVERIGEGQRFVTQILTESPQRSLNAAQQLVEFRAREPVGERRL